MQLLVQRLAQRSRTGPPSDAELHGLATQWWSRGAGRRTPDDLRAELEAELGERYRAAGLAAPSVRWCGGPRDFADAVADPRAGRGLPLAVRSAISLVGMALGLVTMILGLSVIAGLVGGALVGAAALIFQVLLRALAAVGVPISTESPAGDALFLVLMAGALVAMVLLLPRALSLPILGTLKLRVLRPRRWFDDVSERLRRAGPEEERPADLPVDALPLCVTLRGAVIALAPPTAIQMRDVGGHQVLEAGWPGDPRVVFVDGERVPEPPDAATAGRQGELFAQSWVRRHVGAGHGPRWREDVEQAVRDCYRLLGLPVPALHWCATPPDYDREIASALRVERRNRWGPRDRRQATTGVVASRIWHAARPEVDLADARDGASGQISGVVTAAAEERWRPWRAQSALGVDTAALWRWARLLRAGDAGGSAAGAPEDPDDLLAALERTACVAWTGTPHHAVLLEPPASVVRGRLAGGDAGQALLETATVTWADGSQWHLLGGVRMPRAAQTGGWTPNEISVVRNTEVRRVMIEQIGWESYLEQAELPLVGEAPDPANPPHHLRLYDFRDTEWGDRRLLVMTNGSPGRDGRPRRFAEFVPARFDDPVAAAAWQYGVTTEIYRALERRT